MRLWIWIVLLPQANRRGKEDKFSGGESSPLFCSHSQCALWGKL